MVSVYLQVTYMTVAFTVRVWGGSWVGHWAFWIFFFLVFTFFSQALQVLSSAPSLEVLPPPWQGSRPGWMEL